MNNSTKYMEKRRLSQNVSRGQQARDRLGERKLSHGTFKPGATDQAKQPGQSRPSQDGAARLAKGYHAQRLQHSYGRAGSAMWNHERIGE